MPSGCPRQEAFLSGQEFLTFYSHLANEEEPREAVCQLNKSKLILGIPIDRVPTSKKMRILHLRVCQVPSQFKDGLVEKVS